MCACDLSTQYAVCTHPKPSPPCSCTASDQRLEAVKVWEPASINSSCLYLGQKPTNRDLTLIKYRDGGEIKRLKLVDNILNKWDEVGRYLGIQEPKLQAWRTQTGNDPKRCCDNVVANWLQNPPDEYPLTWRGLIDLLEDADFTQLVKDLKKALANKV